MKKTLLFGIAALAATSLSSCLKDDDNKITTTYPIAAYNLFTPIEAGSDKPFTGSTIYNCVVEMPAGTMTIATSGMPTPGGTTGSFETIPMTITSKNVTDSVFGGYVNSFKADRASNEKIKITDFSGYITNAVYLPPTSEELKVVDSKYPIVLPSSTTMNYLFLQYQYGENWKVRTFWPDLTYHGETVTTYPQNPNPFHTRTIEYRVVMQMKDLALTSKADVIIYNAKFAAEQPMTLSAIVVPGLDLEFTENGYTLSGTDVIPLYIDGGELLPIPRFIFNELKASVSGKLDGISMSYKVAGMYDGIFTGNCVVQ